MIILYRFRMGTLWVQQQPGLLELDGYGLWSRASNGITPGDALGWIEDLVKVFIKSWMDGLISPQAERIERLVQTSRGLHCLPGEAMGLAEGNAFADQIICQVGRQHSGVDGGSHAFGMRADGRHRARQHG